jgi:hypothetical protein
MALAERPQAAAGERLPVELIKWSAVWGAMLLAGFVLWNTLSSTADLATPLPYLDQWDIVREVQAWDDGSYETETWWSQHDEHRPVVPRLFFYADFWFFGGRNVSNYVEIFLFHGVLVAIVASSAWGLVRRRADRLFTGAVILSAVVALGFSIVQVENFIHAFQVLAMLGFMAAVAAFGCLALAKGRRPLARYALVLAAILLTTVSQFSFANGMLAWPVLLVMAWRLRLGRPALAAILATGGLLVALHYASYTPIPGRSPADALEHPVRLVIFWFRVIGSPFIPVLQEEASTVLGAAGLAAYGLLLYRDIRLPSSAISRATALLHGLMAFSVLSAAAVAAGRSPLGLFWAEAPRYAQGPLLFWAALFALGWLALERGVPPLAWQTAGLAGGFALALVAALTPDEAMPPWDNLFGSFDQAEDSLYTGVLDRDVLALLFPYERTAELGPLVDYLRENEYSVFRDGNADNLVGRPLDEVAPRRETRCQGQFDATLPVKNVGLPGSLVAGWAWDPREEERPPRVVIVDREGTIIGQATAATVRTDVRIALEITTDEVGWAGYARATPDAARAFALLEDGSACLLNGEMPIPAEVLTAG